MTREELIRYGKDYYRDLITACCKIDEKHKEFVRESIQALEQELCDDAISREDVINLKWQGGASEEFLEGYANAIEDARVLPPVKPQEQNTGHWILKIEDWNKWICSECGYTKRTDIHVSLGYDFCPMCGAKMD